MEREDERHGRRVGITAREDCSAVEPAGAIGMQSEGGFSAGSKLLAPFPKKISVPRGPFIRQPRQGKSGSPFHFRN
jgi:hypothetical protein